LAAGCAISSKMVLDLAHVYRQKMTTEAATQLLGQMGKQLIGVLGVSVATPALAAQKSLENLFGGIMLIMDQPVHVGDFCRFGDQVGTVEDIGVRSTRIRTLERTLVTIPNAEFASLQIENFARRDRIFLSVRIGVRYETTPDQLRHLLIELKKMLLAHPKVDPDPARVRFANLGAYSLDLDIFAYVRTTDYNEFLAVREDLFLRMMDVVSASGTGFAFPSQTNYDAREGWDTEKVRAVEATVQRWREAGTLFLPDVPSHEAAKLSGTLDYPPKGSAPRG
jgi:MscS family membrane protein